MRLPNADRAIIPPEKLRDYSLSTGHSVGGPKAHFFQSMGFRQDAWPEVETAIRAQHLKLDADEIEPNEYGRKFAIVGPLTGPSGDTAMIKSIWIILTGEDMPRLVSVYPE